MRPSLFILVIFFVSDVTAELYTALVDLEELLGTEEPLINVLQEYIETEEARLALLKRFAQIYRDHHNQASEDAHAFVSNPINAYLLVKRFTADWNQVEGLMRTNLSYEYLMDICKLKGTMKFPTDEDLKGATSGLIRLQETYNLDTSSIARGELLGVKYSPELSASDCFELGRQSYIDEDYHYATLWMQESQARLDNDTNQMVERSDILEYLAFSAYKLGKDPFLISVEYRYPGLICAIGGYFASLTKRDFLQFYYQS